MIDLTKKHLPDTVCIGGTDYAVYTDFRKWMRFEIEVGKMSRTNRIDVSYLFKGTIPLKCSIEELFVFSRPFSPLPRNVRHSNVIALDYEVDADYIYAAFYSQYGIDLVKDDLHWHQFLALLKGLKDDEMLCKIMGYRCYSKTDARRDVYEELRQQWTIIQENEDQEELDAFNRLFS